MKKKNDCLDRDLSQAEKLELLEAIAKDYLDCDLEILSDRATPILQKTTKHKKCICCFDRDWQLDRQDIVHHPISILAEKQSINLLPKLFESLLLSKREAEVLFWIYQEKNNREIALLLNISENTVRKHLERIYQILNVNDRAAAIVRALKKLGLLNVIEI
jgi:DNA-binding CsgD family transcriptional regulator